MGVWITTGEETKEGLNELNKQRMKQVGEGAAATSENFAYSLPDQKEIIHVIFCHLPQRVFQYSQTPSLKTLKAANGPV